MTYLCKVFVKYFYLFVVVVVVVLFIRVNINAKDWRFSCPYLTNELNGEGKKQQAAKNNHAHSLWHRAFLLSKIRIYTFVEWSDVYMYVLSNSKVHLHPHINVVILFDSKGQNFFLLAYIASRWYFLRRWISIDMHSISSSFFFFFSFPFKSKSTSIMSSAHALPIFCLTHTSTNKGVFCSVLSEGGAWSNACFFPSSIRQQCVIVDWHYREHASNAWSIWVSSSLICIVQTFIWSQSDTNITTLSESISNDSTLFVECIREFSNKFQSNSVANLVTTNIDYTSSK